MHLRLDLIILIFVEKRSKVHYEKIFKTKLESAYYRFRSKFSISSLQNI
jgi:hypothetical protein